MLKKDEDLMFAKMFDQVKGDDGVVRVLPLGQEGEHVTRMDRT
jgi:hypothetical protein